MTIDGAASVLAVETATDELLELLDPHGAAQLLLSGSRAAALSLGNDRDAADPARPVLIARAGWLDAGRRAGPRRPGAGLGARAARAAAAGAACR